MRSAILAIVALAVCTSDLSVAATTQPPAVTPAAPQNACEREMAVASKKYDVPLGVLYAVGLTESGHRSSLQPLAMNLGGTPYYAKTLDDALQKFAEGQAAGIKLIDVGCMQIDHYFHSDQFPSVAAMFDPHANVDYGARLLHDLYGREGTWTLAVARYHAGPNADVAQKQYVCTVITNMVATGFAAWTDGARSFCGVAAP